MLTRITWSLQLFKYEQSEYESLASSKVSQDVHTDYEKNQLLDDQLHTNDELKFLRT